MDEDHDHTDLGVSPKEEFGGGPPMSISSIGEGGSNEKRYPSFHYSGPKELDLPEEGSMKICFCKTSETSRTLPSGKHWYECTIEVKCFGGVEADEDDEGDETPGTDAEKALDTLARALGKEKTEGSY
jgi:hypothetical protein